MNPELPLLPKIFKPTKRSYYIKKISTTKKKRLKLIPTTKKRKKNLCLQTEVTTMKKTNIPFCTKKKSKRPLLIITIILLLNLF